MKVRKAFEGEFIVYSFSNELGKIGKVYLRLKKGWNQLHISINLEFQNQGFAEKLIGYVVDQNGYVNIPNGRIANVNMYKVIEKMKNKYEVQFDKEFEEYKISKKNLNEDITLPIEVGDEIRTGKFLNKKTIVKELGKDEHGMPTINNKSIFRIRVPKLEPKKKKIKESLIDEILSEGYVLPKTFKKLDQWKDVSVNSILNEY